jgi:hypothetical protein
VNYEPELLEHGILDGEDRPDVPAEPQREARQPVALEVNHRDAGAGSLDDRGVPLPT